MKKTRRPLSPEVAMVPASSPILASGAAKPHRNWWGTIAASIAIFSGVAWAQTPVQGRDYVTPAWRGIAVDVTGKVILSSSSTGCIGTVLVPCRVAGPDAEAAAPTQSPVRVAGWDGTLLRTIKTDTSGQSIPANASSANADAVSNTNISPTGAAAGTILYRNLNYLFNGATWDRARGTTVGAFVQGAVAEAVAPTQNPARIGGWDGTLMRTIKTDTAGQGIPANASTANADGVSNTQPGPTGAAAGPLFYRMTPYAFNGATADRVFTCPLQANIAFSASGNTQIAALSGSTVIRICHVSVSTDAATNLKFTQGTGSNCGTGTADITGLYYNFGFLALDFGPSAALLGTAANAICINSSAVVNGGGVVKYAQF